MTAFTNLLRAHFGRQSQVVLAKLGSRKVRERHQKWLDRALETKLAPVVPSEQSDGNEDIDYGVEAGVGVLAVGSVFDVALWRQQLSADSSQFLEGMVNDFGAREAERMGVANLVSTDPRVRAMINSILERLDLIEDTTADEIGGILETAGLSPLADTLDDIGQVFARAQEVRAFAIAGDTVHQAQQSSALAVAEHAVRPDPDGPPTLDIDGRPTSPVGPLQKMWVSVGDDRVRDSHETADGQVQDLGDPFIVGDDLLMYPLDPDGSMAETCNCRCSSITLPASQPTDYEPITTFVTGQDPQTKTFAWFRAPRPHRHVKVRKAPAAAGIAVRAADTGRVLMLQRALDPDDPAGGTWEWPGGHVEDGETSRQGAEREWEEETGHPLPPGVSRGSWTSPNGVYKGFVHEVPTEAHVTINRSHEDRSVENPDDPDGDRIETAAFWDPAHLPDLPALRPELRTGMDWTLLGDAPGVEKKDAHDVSDENRDHGKFTAGADVGADPKAPPKKRPVAQPDTTVEHPGQTPGSGSVTQHAVGDDGRYHGGHPATTSAPKTPTHDTSPEPHPQTGLSKPETYRAAVDGNGFKAKDELTIHPDGSTEFYRGGELIGSGNAGTYDKSTVDFLRKGGFTKLSTPTLAPASAKKLAAAWKLPASGKGVLRETPLPDAVNKEALMVAKRLPDIAQRAIADWVYGETVREIQTGAAGKQVCNAFDQAMKAMPTVPAKVPLFRGVSNSGAKFAASLKVGDNLELNEPVSTALNPTTASGFGHFVYQISSGRAAVLGGKAAEDAGETEMVLPLGQYKVTGVEKVNYKYNSTDSRALTVIHLKDTTKGSRTFLARERAGTANALHKLKAQNHKPNSRFADDDEIGFTLASGEGSSGAATKGALYVTDAQFKGSDEARDDHGRWTSGGTATMERVTEITAAQARGDSRPVSSDEFQRLAHEGKAQLAAMRANASPLTGMDEKWSAIKDSAYVEVTKPWGGATIDGHTGIALEPDADKYALTVKPPGVDSVSVPETANAAEFSKAMDEAKDKFRSLLEPEAAYLGVFHDDDNHRIDIDPVVCVDSVHDVETIGAFTYAIGGAYRFADGNGYWPPHVTDSATKSGDITVHWKGPGQWRSAAVAAQAPLAGLKTEVKYSADQPRDDHGRFGSGGGDSLTAHSGPDGKVSLDRLALHQQIVGKVLGGAPKSAHPTALFLGGGPASGKSTVLKGMARVGATIDSDAIKAQLPEYQERLAAGDSSAAAYVHEESSLIGKLAMGQAITDSKDFTLDGTGDTSIEKITAKVQQARSAGYKVKGLYVTVDTNEAVARSAARGAKTGRVVPETAIRATHASVSGVFRKAIDTNLFDSVELWDNNTRTPLLVGSKADGRKWQVRDQAAWEKFLAKENEPLTGEAVESKGAARMSRGESAIRLLRALTTGRTFEQSGVPATSESRAMWVSLGREVADIRTAGGEVDVPHDYSLD